MWIGNKKVEQLPAPVPLGNTVALESGDIMIAIKPLTLTNLGRREQIRLRVMEDDTLVLEMDNYRGPRKSFWELAWPGTFFQGQPQCGFYSEVANRSAYDNGAAFAKAVDSGTVRDFADPKATYTGKESRIWHVEYERDGRKFGLQVDLYDWFRPARRWNQDGELGWPMLKSSRAEQSKKGRIEVDGVALKTREGQAAWLYVSPSGETVAAAYHGPEPSAFHLQLKNLEKGSNLESVDSASFVKIAILLINPLILLAVRLHDGDQFPSALAVGSGHFLHRRAQQGNPAAFEPLYHPKRTFGSPKSRL